MIIALVILSIVTFILLLITAGLSMHVVAILKELKAISEEQSTQNRDIRNLIMHAQNTSNSIHDIAVFLKDDYRTKTYLTGEGGEA